jgi:hypothetical protein
MQKNVSGQKWTVFAFDRTTLIPATGDASNITAKIGKDGGAYGATNDVNPTEKEDGFYEFDLTQAETNANTIIITPVSITTNIQVLGVPALIDTTPVDWADDAIQTGDAFSLIGLGGSGLTDLGGMSTAMKAEVNAEADTALTDYDGPTKAEMDAAHSLLATSGDLAVVDGIVDNILLDTWTGTGARSAIIRVNDGTSVIQNAKVRMTLNAESYLSTTDVNGDTGTFGLENDGTWNVTITAPGYQSQVTTLAISTNIAAGDQIYSLTENVITAPSDPSLCRIGAYVQFNGAAEEGATFKSLLSGRNLTTDGIVVNQNTSALTNSSGYAYLDLIRQDQFVDGSGIYELSLINAKGRLIFKTSSAIPNSGTANLVDLI